MKIQVVSDTHLNAFQVNLEADLLIHLGDVGNGKIRYITDLQHLGVPYLFVAGNHDFFGHDIDAFYAELDALGINYLRENKVFEMNGFKFVGGTLFSHFELYSQVKDEVQHYQLFAQAFVADFKRIKYQGHIVTPEDYVHLFQAQWDWIQRFRHEPNVVICTHFVPNIAGLDPFYANHECYQDLNPYFVNNLDLTGFKLWLCGHTHTAIDTVVDGCRLLCNPFGYGEEQYKNGFIDQLTVTLTHETTFTPVTTATPATSVQSEE